MNKTKLLITFFIFSSLRFNQCTEEYQESKTNILESPSYEIEILKGQTTLASLCKRFPTHTPTSHTSIFNNELHCAIGTNDIATIQHLIKRGYRINHSRCGASGATPLHTAVQHYALSKNDPDQQKRYLKTIELLLSLGSNPKEKNFWNEDIQAYAHRKGVTGDLQRFIKN